MYHVDSDPELGPVHVVVSMIDILWSKEAEGAICNDPVHTGPWQNGLGGSPTLNVHDRFNSMLFDFS